MKSRNLHVRWPTVAGAILLLGALLLVLGAAYFIVLFLCFPTWAARGVFGASWGGLSALFSGAGLLGVGLALLFQAKQLNTQSLQVQNSLLEQEALRKAMMRQTRALALGTYARVLYLRLEAKHQGYGSGKLRGELCALEDLSAEMLEDIQKSWPSD